MKLSEGAEKAAIRRSLPVRGAWIEILNQPDKLVFRAVAPRKGSVD